MLCIHLVVSQRRLIKRVIAKSVLQILVLLRFQTEVEDWERRLMLFARTLDEWMKCQRNWLYLEPVFTTADIQRQLPQDASLFNQVGFVD